MRARALVSASALAALGCGGFEIPPPDDNAGGASAMDEHLPRQAVCAAEDDEPLEHPAYGDPLLGIERAVEPLGPGGDGAGKTAQLAVGRQLEPLRGAALGQLVQRELQGGQSGWLIAHGPDQLGDQRALDRPADRLDGSDDGHLQVGG